ncbi:MAG: response regulator [Bdellovibrionaceae bacterium]|nr:response regulator [Pseudobdellovibrionaceae bacterium]
MQDCLLIVDDEAVTRTVLCEYLRGLDVQIFVAHDGAEALEIVKKNKITAVLSDISMPKMKGTELLQQMRSLGYLTPFVILTAFGDKRTALEALRLGAFDFIGKPPERERLISVTRKILELGREIIFWENKVDFQSENVQHMITTLTSEEDLDFKKKL